MANGFDRVWFVIIVVVTTIASVTPAVGMDVLVLKVVLPDVPVARIFGGRLPWIGVCLIHLGMLLEFPAIMLRLGRTPA